MHEAAKLNQQWNMFHFITDFRDLFSFMLLIQIKMPTLLKYLSVS